MQDLISLFNEAVSYQQQGDFAKARHLYDTILSRDETYAKAWHMLGILHAEEDHYQDAIHAIQRAIKIDPASPIFHLHLANIQRASGDLTNAEKTLLDLIELTPHFAAGYNNLGVLYQLQERYQEAILLFQRALDIQPNYQDAYYNLGLTHLKSGNLADAKHIFTMLIEINPLHPGAIFQLGRVEMHQFAYQHAKPYFEKLIREHPYHFESLTNLATCCLRLGNLLGAKTYYLQALAIANQDTQVLYNLGVIAMAQSKVNEAIDYYLQVIKLDPNDVNAIQNTAAAYLIIGDKAAALLHFKRAQQLLPNNDVIRHTIDIITQNETLTSSPPGYIQALFNSYASHFDAHLTRSLHYQVPIQLFSMLKDNCDIHDKRFDILDLGCGTGLSGIPFKPVARSLIGVDIADQMLTEARTKAIYNELHQADILTYLTNTTVQFDLIIAADTIVYFGDLEPIMEKISVALKKDGHCLFNLELSPTFPYKMGAGRFLHHPDYVREVIEKVGLRIVKRQSVPFRTQNHKPVMGDIYLLEHGVC